jgi:ABC-type multidrug transport system fused ATPase/permease subunit
LKDSPIILLDEATSALDSTNEEEVMKLLSIEKAKGKTIIFITHRLSINTYSDRVIVMG